MKAREQHGPHKGYTDIVRNLLETWAGKNPEYTPKQARKFIEAVAKRYKDIIRKNDGVVK